MGLRGWLAVALALVQPMLLFAGPLTSSAMSSAGGSTAPIDEQLYSRQMLVHGAAAQARLAGSSVLVLGNG